VNLNGRPSGPFMVCEVPLRYAHGCHSRTLQLTTLRFIFISSSSVCLRLSSCPFYSDFPAKILYAFLVSHIGATFHPLFVVPTACGKQHKV
jgi:hypothetical protein